uniref:Uncharacterized protein n=1 Tax=Arundo donax TaxID=35708 RepID=A0A0A9DFR4_ARUDO
MKHVNKYSKQHNATHGHGLLPFLKSKIWCWYIYDLFVQSYCTIIDLMANHQRRDSGSLVVLSCTDGSYLIPFRSKNASPNPDL